MSYWGDDIQPGPLKRQCASCGRHEHLDRLNLCETCRGEYDAEMVDMEMRERDWDDDEAGRNYYGA
jgi:hypothetical protein